METKWRWRFIPFWPYYYFHMIDGLSISCCCWCSCCCYSTFFLSLNGKQQQHRTNRDWRAHNIHQQIVTNVDWNLFRINLAARTRLSDLFWIFCCCFDLSSSANQNNEMKRKHPSGKVVVCMCASRSVSFLTFKNWTNDRNVDICHLKCSRMNKVQDLSFGKCVRACDTKP